VTHDVCRIDDLGPLPVTQPASVADLGDLVRRAAADGQALYPLGGRTALDHGLSPTKPGVAVDLRGLNQVIDYPARDMTVTVQAGVTVAELRRLLAAEKQRLPIDAPDADRATLGGLIATNHSGPRRYGWGTLRDYVIGISVVNDHGVETKAGGRVVKNVAGYDLCKLHVGALGTLGVVTQVTLKLRPLPEGQALLALSCRGEQVEATLEALHRSRTRPVCLELLNAAALPFMDVASRLPEPPAWTVVVGYEDNLEALTWQVPQLVREFQAALPAVGLVGSVAEPWWRGLTEFAARPDAALTFRASVRPSGLAAFCQELTQLAPRLALQAHAGNGVVIGQLPADAAQAEAEQCVAQARQLAGKVQGHVVVLRCAAAWKRALSVWGPPPAHAWLLRAVKEQLDPQRLFNPGRFVDGI
jgi:glycolate oxidase FAD binding subunit